MDFRAMVILASDRKYPPTRRVRRIRKYVYNSHHSYVYRADVCFKSVQNVKSVQNATYNKHALNNQQTLKEDTSRRNSVPTIPS